MFCTTQYAVFHGEKVMKAIIADLKLAISDQNLELIPDYEQRIEVLKELKFIDENSTVSLKGRVACEVSSFAFGDHCDSDDPRLIPPMNWFLPSLFSKTHSQIMTQRKWLLCCRVLFSKRRQI